MNYDQRSLVMGIALLFGDRLEPYGRHDFLAQIEALHRGCQYFGSDPWAFQGILEEHYLPYAWYLIFISQLIFIQDVIISLLI